MNRIAGAAHLVLAAGSARARLVAPAFRLRGDQQAGESRAQVPGDHVVHPAQVSVRGPDVAAAGGVLPGVEQGCRQIRPRRYGVMNEFFRCGGVTAALGGACGEQHDRRLFAACGRGGGECGERLCEVGTLSGAALDFVREITGHGLRCRQVAERLRGPLSAIIEQQAERLRAGHDVGATEIAYSPQVPGRAPDRDRPAEGLQAARPQYLADWRQR